MDVYTRVTCHVCGVGMEAGITSHFAEEGGVLRDPRYAEGGGRSAHGNNQLVVLEGEGARVAGGGALAEDLGEWEGNEARWQNGGMEEVAEVAEVAGWLNGRSGRSGRMAEWQNAGPAEMAKWKKWRRCKKMKEGQKWQR